MSIDLHRLVGICWVHQMGCRVAVDTEVSSDLLNFNATDEWKDASIYYHGYLCEFLFCSEGVKDLMEISVTFVRCEEASVDHDDSCGPWHFELEIGIVWDSHE